MYKCYFSRYCYTDPYWDVFFASGQRDYTGEENKYNQILFIFLWNDSSLTSLILLCVFTFLLSTAHVPHAPPAHQDHHNHHCHQNYNGYDAQNNTNNTSNVTENFSVPWGSCGRKIRDYFQQLSKKIIAKFNKQYHHTYDMHCIHSNDNHTKYDIPNMPWSENFYFTFTLFIFSLLKLPIPFSQQNCSCILMIPTCNPQCKTLLVFRAMCSQLTDRHK